VYWDFYLEAMTTADNALFQWVPIRSLAPRHRERAAQHLLALEPRDRYLRFGYAATDEQVRRYVDGLDFERDELFGIFNRKLVLIAMAHLAYAPEAKTPEQRRTAEFGVSVLKQARGRGYGARLFDRAMLHARNRGCDRLFIHALSENSAMLKIAANAGATVQRDGPESEAWLKLPPDDLASRVDELVSQQAAELDFRFKVHAHRMNRLMGMVRDVGDHISEKGRIASE
jgi:RimJ/RimL family protein N-acetyltransferase